MRSDSRSPSGQAGRGRGALQVKDAQRLLDLAKRDVRRAEEDFKELGFDTQLATARSLQSDALQEWLLLSEDCTDLVRALPSVQLHQAIREIGEEDALPVLATASSEQVQDVLDIEWFVEGRLDHSKVRYWMELLMEINESEAGEVINGLDPNALVEFLRARVKPGINPDLVHLAASMDEPYLFTPEDLQSDDELVRRFLAYFYSVDRDLFGKVAELLIVEDPEIVLKDLAGDREDRLVRHGFPLLSRADHLLDPIDLSVYEIQWAPDLEPERVSSTHALDRSESELPFFIHALSWGHTQGCLNKRTETELLEECTAMANALLLSHTRDAGDPEGKREAFEAAQTLISVGLEALAKSRVPTAVELLLMKETEELFRVGWTLTRMVAGQAREFIGVADIDTEDYEPGLLWLSDELRSAVLEAEACEHWRGVVRRTPLSICLGPDGEDSAAFSWPRLRYLRSAVLRAWEEFELLTGK